ncbi:MAG: Maf family nucleotide pyrophosphatase [Tannerellaceae bacterium]|jgi:septum formation protein|nr:Maf family nucleotide pyrophosphatase [Tannerellaceae bacterium]
MLALSYKVVLGSQSPRRKELLKEIIPFEVKEAIEVDETWPPSLQVEEIPVYVARKKAAAYLPSLEADELLITADTIVVLDRTVLGKPSGREDAVRMLRMLSGRTHRVLTGVCLTARQKTVDFSVASTVRFAPIGEEDIQYYIDRFQPYDKAGAYGIQEWIGYIAVEEIAGSFYNVMGLPVQRLYQELSRF